ncbi:hypothetical protein B0H63DRAFT_292987 [Podospora didyma]|uniref:Uncharacterized protein n=1 Tax=Podospora didyma TaxID=330526 RepID=A0AAE0KAJ2_9PEZI|nr:hypothetical protein B0H63DRAFT_292987 [Podospora didyma]
MALANMGPHRRRIQALRQSGRRALQWHQSLSSTKNLTHGQEVLLDLAELVTSNPKIPVHAAITVWTRHLYAKPQNLQAICSELGLAAGSGTLAQTHQLADLTRFLACLNSWPGGVLQVLSSTVHFYSISTTGSGGLVMCRSPLPFCIVSMSDSWFLDENDSVTFRLFKSGEGSKNMYHLSLVIGKGEPAVAEYLSDLLGDIMAAFRNGQASPRDLDEHGQTLLHHLMHAFRYEGPWPKYFIDHIRTTMLALRDAGVPIDRTCDYGESTLSYALVGYQNPADFAALIALRELCRLLVDQGVEVPSGSGVKGYKCPTARYALESVYCPELREVFGNGPVLNAYGSRSMAQVLATEHLARESDAPNLFGHTPIDLACFWPEGLKHLLQTMSTETDSCLKDIIRSSKPMGYATFYSSQVCPTGCDKDCTCTETMELLFATGYAALPMDQVEQLWSVASQKARLLLLDELAIRRRQLKDLALSSLRPSDIAEEEGLAEDNHALPDIRAGYVAKRVEELGIEVPYSLTPLRHEIEHHYNSPFGIFFLDHDNETAEHAFAIGFRDINKFRPTGELPMHAADHYLSAWQTYCFGWPNTRLFQYHAWLLNHGVSLCQVLTEESTGLPYSWDTKLSTTLAHTEAKLLAEFVGNFERNHSKHLMNPALLQVSTSVFSTSVTDKCRCHCMITAGCSPLLAALKGVTHRGVGQWENSGAWCLSVNRLVHLWRGLSAEMVHAMFLQVIRFMTFESLQLEHTCCTDYFHARFDYDPADYDSVDWSSVHERFYPDTRNVEKVWADNKLRTTVLNNVMEILEPQWHTFEGGLPAFLHTHWEPVIVSAIADQRKLEEGLSWQERPRRGILRWECLAVHDVRAHCGTGPAAEREFVARIGIKVEDGQKCDHSQPWLDDFGDTI